MSRKILARRKSRIHLCFQGKLHKTPLEKSGLYGPSAELRLPQSSFSPRHVIILPPRNGHFPLQDGHSAMKCTEDVSHLAVRLIFLPTYFRCFTTQTVFCTHMPFKQHSTTKKGGRSWTLIVRGLPLFRHVLSLPKCGREGKTGGYSTSNVNRWPHSLNTYIVTLFCVRL